ncbi:MAG: DUF1800 family protein [Verrucomicrobiota bacterium JB023]|nr:DUF1800 family protein [Verrucomicrobiota bacterium JB023]
MKSFRYLAVAAFGIVPANAQEIHLWEIGSEDGQSSPFSQENFHPDEAPGSPATLDDHFYLAGEYPSPIGVLSENEAEENFERAITSSDPSVVIHFPLTEEEASSTARFRLETGFLWTGSSQGEASNIVRFLLNGEVIHVTPEFDEYEDFEFFFDGSDASLNPGPNTLTIERIGTTPSSWLSIDFVSLWVDSTALTDDDDDGIPLWWERDHLLDDSQAEDASSDPDQDGSDNLAEFLAHTDPRLPDSDGDGLLDGYETLTDPLVADTDGDGLLDGEESESSAHLSDSDDDGAPDGWEMMTGYNPLDPTSTPPSWPGSIGINFTSGDYFASVPWSPSAPNGWIPQTNWNHTVPLRHWGTATGEPPLSGDQSVILSPTPATLVNSTGEATALTFTFQHNGALYNHNAGNSTADLLSQYLTPKQGHPATVTLSNIPYPNHDILIYLSGRYYGPTAHVSLDGGDPLDRLALGVAPFRDFVVNDYTASNHSAPKANVLHLRNLTGASHTIELTSEAHAGIAAIQIIDNESDHDEDGLPDYWEILHRTPLAAPNASDDPDGDGLSNLQEFERGTNPKLADTDGDGLSDLVETGTNNYVDPSNTGTNPLFGDSDGDGLADGDEVDSLFFSNPLLSDSDLDGQSDKIERVQQTDPTSASHSLPPIPSQADSNGFFWEVGDIQLVWDHTTPGVTDSNTTRELAEVYVRNEAHESWRPLRLTLLRQGETLGVRFHSHVNGAFVRTEGWDIWSSHYDESFTHALGFSGYGTHDISDLLAFRVEASPAESHWTTTFSLINQTSGETVYTETYTTTPDATILDGSAVWGTFENGTGAAGLSSSSSLSAYLSATPLETLPAFVAHADQDDDGMPDQWETAHHLNPSDAADATDDEDGDGLTNREEYLRGTNPLLADSDADSVSDLLELSRLSDPLDSDSVPPYLFSGGQFEGDADRDGLPDIWQILYGIPAGHAQLDPDNDGLTNEIEGQAGTNPFDAESGVFLSLLETNNSIHLNWTAPPFKSTALQAASSLGPETAWQDIDLPFGTTSALLEPSSPASFYRTRVTNLDGDADQLPDWIEAALGLDFTVAHSAQLPVPVDTDRDGILDGELSGDLVNYLETWGEPDAQMPTRSQAARLLMQASFGPTLDEIGSVRALGIEGWIDHQIDDVPATFHHGVVEVFLADFFGARTRGDYSYSDEYDYLDGSNIQTIFARAAINGEDQLRQRVAFALSEIIVVSRRDANITNRIEGLATFYDLFVEHAFGSYEDLLFEVTRHPVMGRYLSHLGNQPPAPEINRYPDENYAREVMQLFAIGLWKLNPDGTRQLDGEGQPIPTYTNDEITNMARVMTGFWYGGNPWGEGGWQDNDFAVPMTMHDRYHDFGEKVLLDGYTLPARVPTRENALRDVRDAISHLVEHPTCAPFVSKSLIQFLVTSNPSPAYVARVSAVFSDNGAGETGDLGAVIKAILMDPEARDPSVHRLASDYGLLREPVIRTMHLARLTNFDGYEKLQWRDDSLFAGRTFQAPLYSPSVFNFFRPDHSPPGVLTEAGLYGPAFEILNSYSAVSLPNTLWTILDDGFSYYNTYHFPPNYAGLLDLASNHELLVDQLNLLCCGGQLTSANRATILEALDAADPTDHEGRVKLALYLFLMTPEGAVQR